MKSSENVQVTLQFELTCMSELSKATDNYTLDLQIVPCNSKEYEKYTENEKHQACVNSNFLNPLVNNGCPCGDTNSPLPYVVYGYPGGGWNLR